MACEAVDAASSTAYVDGELDPVELRELGEHLRGCASCAVNALERVQMKRSVQTAGKRYSPSAELRNRIAEKVAKSVAKEVA